MRTACFFLLMLLSFVSSAAFELQEDLLTDIEIEFGADARLRLETWQALTLSAVGLPPKQQLERVNDFFNRIPFVSDSQHWDTEDYWATPIELLATFGADCEDYSIAKYLTLRALGIDEDQLRITYVKALELDQAHMVLSYYPTPESDPWIMDNLINDIKPASQRADLKPVYSFNAEGLWLTKLKRRDEHRIGDSSRLKRWSDLNRRMFSAITP